MSGPHVVEAARVLLHLLEEVSGRHNEWTSFGAIAGSATWPDALVEAACDSLVRTGLFERRESAEAVYYRLAEPTQTTPF